MDKSRNGFFKPGNESFSRGHIDQGIIYHYLLTGVAASQMELLNAIASLELSSYQKANVWQINRMSDHENSAYKGSWSSVDRVVGYMSKQSLCFRRKRIHISLFYIFFPNLEKFNKKLEVCYLAMLNFENQ